MTSFYEIVWQNAMVEVIEEWFTPITLFDYHDRYMINFISLWD
jgi:hypothetical protein